MGKFTGFCCLMCMLLLTACGTPETADHPQPTAAGAAVSEEQQSAQTQEPAQE